TGCLMYELLTGRPPFTGDSPVAIAYQHVRENPIPPSRLDPSLPPWADSIVLKAMAKSPNDRYQSAAEMQADIQRAASGMQVAAAMQPPTRADYYEAQRTHQMGPQTMMGVAPTTVSPYQQTGYQTGYQQPYGNGGYDGGQEQRRGSRRWIPWVISGLVVLAAIIVAVIMLNNGGGGGTVNVPLVNGESYAQAAVQIKAAGLNAVENKEASSTVPSGKVISTNPDNGNSVAKNSTVTVNVSTGAANITLPNLTGSQASQAEQQLKTLGFTNVTPTVDAQSTAPSGQVDHMTPAPGSYPPNQPITLFVSGGGQPVPNVVNSTAAVAQAILQQDGFKVATNSTPAPASQMVQPGTVYNQNPAANQVEPKGTLIQIFVQPQSTATATPTDTSTPTGTATPTGGGTPTDGGTPTSTPTTGGGGLGGL
ncbi:MAG TPA: PASTA domain-containing protein, partial [Pseudonocardiaceae bacterium]